MAIPKAIKEARGLWKGKNKLNLPWLAPEKRVTESESSLHVETDSQGKYATITYIWGYEGKREEGTIILTQGAKSSHVQMGWADSWHESDAVLHLKGEEAPTGSVKCKGEYAAGKKLWGWTIEIVADHDKLMLRMENVTPAGEATWAMEAHYTRG